MTVNAQRLEALIKEYSDIFGGRLSITVYEYHIKDTELEKFIRRVYLISMKYQEEVQVEIQRILDQRTVKRSTSSFFNPLVVIKKKFGEIWLCLNMQNMNNLVDKEFDYAHDVV